MQKKICCPPCWMPPQKKQPDPRWNSSCPSLRRSRPRIAATGHTLRPLPGPMRQDIKKSGIGLGGTLYGAAAHFSRRAAGPPASWNVCWSRRKMAGLSTEAWWGRGRQMHWAKECCSTMKAPHLGWAFNPSMECSEEQPWCTHPSTHPPVSMP